MSDARTNHMPRTVRGHSETLAQATVVFPEFADDAEHTATYLAERAGKRSV